MPAKKSVRRTTSSRTKRPVTAKKVVRRPARVSEAKRHKSIIEFLHWRELARELAEDMKKDNSRSKYKTEFMKMVKHFDKIKLSHFGE